MLFKPDCPDYDADDDGIVDNIEAQATVGYIAPSGSDTDNDGIDNAYDPDNSGTYITPVNTDGTDNPDYTDTNSDNDNYSDLVEAYDTDNDHVANTNPANADADTDGLDDNYDADGTNTTDNGLSNDGGELATDYPDDDNPGNDRDWREVFNPTVTLSASPTTIAENGGVSTITATLTQSTFEDVTITLSYSGTTIGSGTDYTASLTTITISAGSTTGTTTVTSVDDLIYENNETVIADITNVSGGGASENGTQQETITITDDETAPTVTLSASPITITENPVQVSTLTATLSNITFEDVIVTLTYTGTAAGSGIDYTAASTTITITAGNTTGTTTVTSVDDAIFEGDETVITDIASVTGGGASESGTQQVTVTIVTTECDNFFPNSSSCLGVFLSDIVSTNPPTNYYMPASTTAITGRDNALTLSVGGDMTIIDGAAETEGRTFIYGDLNLNKANGVYNIGVAGVGSYIVPDDGAEMITVGGNLNIAIASTSSYILGGTIGTDDANGLFTYKGTKDAALSIGAADPVSQVINCSSLDLAPYDDAFARIQTLSDQWDALADDDVTYVISSGTITINCTNRISGKTYIINIPDDVDNSGVAASLDFTNFPNDAALIMNVNKAGSGDNISINLNNVLIDGVSHGAALAGTPIAPFALRILWNLNDATTVHITGSAQFWGSIVVPNRASTTTMDLPGMNGRAIFGGDLIHGGSGTEFHSYPFAAADIIPGGGHSCNNTAPVIVDATVSISENSANSTAVYDVNENGTGNDTDADADVLTYSIVSDNGDGIFAIDASTGIITVTDNTNLDYEITTSYNIVVRADDGIDTDDATITINITDITINAVLSVTTHGDENGPVNSRPLKSALFQCHIRLKFCTKN